MNSEETLPRFVRDLIASVPRAGEGVHRWLFRTARYLHPFRNPEEIEEILRGAAFGCGRTISDGEFRNAVQNSRAVAWMPGSPRRGSVRRGSSWPSRNEALVRRTVDPGFGVADLFEQSPLLLGANYPRPFLEILFPEDPLLCMGRSVRRFDTRLLSEWGECRGQSLVVPSPMTAREGRTRAGRPSKHSLDNTGARRFLICELDQGSRDEQAAVLWALKQRAPLVIVVFSGNKSLHGWFDVRDWPDEKARRFFRYAVALGADPRTWPRLQFVRLPEGIRENGNHQRVYYFDPEGLQ